MAPIPVIGRGRYRYQLMRTAPGSLGPYENLMILEYNVPMARGPLIAMICSFFGLAAVVSAFLINASPYVTVAEAKQSSSKSMHLAGDIMKESLNVRLEAGEVRFSVRDEKGDVMPVVYKGGPPANMGSATKVVCVGRVENGSFVADKLILKCPSKYESEASSGAKS